MNALEVFGLDTGPPISIEGLEGLSLESSDHEIKSCDWDTVTPGQRNMKRMLGGQL